MNRFDSILVANRGEIACRIMKSAKQLGYRTIAVFSDADASALHVQMADRAVHIGGSAVSESYLCADKIIAAAKASGAGAIHPGYGFLSENAQFAQACRDAGLVFIGPSSQAIELMGNKADAKRRMLEAGVPCVPGYEGERQDEATLLSEAQTIGFPIMVKAAAGGGGRGMRLVFKQDDLASALKLARAEAESAFGSGELILEKAIERARHVEIQVFADEAGNTINLAERDCSIQRRHQKVIEEAPCPVMTDTLREQMGAAAVTAARSVDYCGAGTVEFLLDEAGAFYFLEMNTRLQVEHPVTELVTGIDLVALQLKVAQGEPLGLTQADVRLNGHAIEVRVYAEDTANGFLPASGAIEHWSVPDMPGIRVDSGIESGQFVSPYYDPMLAKIIAYGEDRETARQRMLACLDRTSLFGVSNNKDFLRRCLQHETFINGQATTAFIGEAFAGDELAVATPEFAHMAAAAVIDCELEHRAMRASAVNVADALTGFSSVGVLASYRRFEFFGDQFELKLHVSQCKSGRPIYAVSCAGEHALITCDASHGDKALLVIDEMPVEVSFHSRRHGELHVMMHGVSALFVDLIRSVGTSNATDEGGRVCTPMHGVIRELKVTAGDLVAVGQTLMIIEAMKMQHEIQATNAGRVSEVLVEVGQQVAAEAVLIEIDVTDDSRVA